MTQVEFSQMLASAKAQFKNGTPLFGEDGAFHKILEDFLNVALEGEMDSDLSSTKGVTNNRRNGEMSKVVRTSMVPSPLKRLVTVMVASVRRRSKIVRLSSPKDYLIIY